MEGKGFERNLSRAIWSILGVSLLLCSCHGERTEAENTVRELAYSGYLFCYEGGGGGSLVDSNSGEPLLEMDDVSFDVEALMNLQEGTSFLDSVDSIGFPLCLGIESQGSLDYLSDDETIYRVSFDGDDLTYLSYEKLDYYAYQTWVDAGRTSSIPEKDLESIHLGIDMAEAVTILGKTFAISGYGYAILHYRIEEGWILSTLWHLIEDIGMFRLWQMIREEVLVDTSDAALEAVDDGELVHVSPQISLDGSGERMVGFHD